MEVTELFLAHSKIHTETLTVLLQVVCVAVVPNSSCSLLTLCTQYFGCLSLAKCKKRKAVAPSSSSSSQLLLHHTLSDKIHILLWLVADWGILISWSMLCCGLAQSKWNFTRSMYSITSYQLSNCNSGEKRKHRSTCCANTSTVYKKKYNLIQNNIIISIAGTSLRTVLTTILTWWCPCMTAQNI
jgi:hypothetical protein